MHKGIVAVATMKTIFVWTSLLLAALSCPSVRANVGTPVDISAHPSIAQVEIRVGIIWVQYCAATVLTNYHALGSANCFSGPFYDPLNRRIRAGAAERSEGGEVRYVAREYNHPSFGLLGSDGDISVVRLETPWTLGDNIQQIPILGEGIYLPDGLRVQLVSWGTTTQGTENADDSLYSIDLYVQNTNACLAKYYELEEPQTITENMICTGFFETGGRDLDNRDIGAPLYYSNVLAAIVSFGQVGAEDSFPVVNTAIAAYTQWIVDTASS